MSKYITPPSFASDSSDDEAPPDPFSYVPLVSLPRSQNPKPTAEDRKNSTSTSKNLRKRKQMPLPRKKSSCKKTKSEQTAKDYHQQSIKKYLNKEPPVANAVESDSDLFMEDDAVVVKENDAIVVEEDDAVVVEEDVNYPNLVQNIIEAAVNDEAEEKQVTRPPRRRSEK